MKKEIADNKTAGLGLPLPDIDNPLNVDVARLINAFKKIDDEFILLKEKVTFLSDPWNAFPLNTPIAVFGLSFKDRNPIMPGETQPRLNWLLCDGGSDNRGGVVPDLRGRFMLGADASHAANTYGGSDSYGGTIKGTAAGNSNNTSLWAAANGSHAHGYWASRGDHTIGLGTAAFANTGNVCSSGDTGYTGNGAGHLHYVSINVSGSATVSGKPPYHTINFIIKVTNQ